MRAVKVLEVGAIKWINRANGWGKKRNVLGMVFEGGSIRGTEFAKAIGAMTKQFHNFIGATEMVQKFRDMIDVCITLDLDVDHHDIMEGEEVLGTGFIHLFPVVSAAFVSEVLEDGGCKGGISLSKAEEAGDSSNIAIDGLKGWLQSEV